MEVSVMGYGGQKMKIEEIPLCVDIIDPTNEGLEDFEPFPSQVLDDLQIEFSLTREKLNPDNPANVKLAVDSLRRALSA
jgi:hypothetical protein